MYEEGSVWGWRPGGRGAGRGGREISSGKGRGRGRVSEEGGRGLKDVTAFSTKLRVC